MREPISHDPAAAEGAIGHLPTLQTEFIWDGRRFLGRALVDTGSAMLHVDQGLLKQLGCPEIGETQNLQTIHGVQAHPFHKVFLGFPASKSGAEVEVVSLDLTGRSYQAIFGTIFLELGTLHLDLRGESYFQFHSASISGKITPPL